MICIEQGTGPQRFAQVDARVRVAVAAAFAVLVCLCEQPATVAIGLTGAVAMFAVSGAAFRPLARRLAVLNAFMLLLAATLPLSVAGDSVLALGPLDWSDTGLARAAVIAARANAAMVALAALLAGLGAAQLGFALRGLGAPRKFVHLLLFMVRYVEVVHQEYRRLRDAMSLRAFHARFDRRTLRAFGFLVGQLLVRSVSRSERIMEAMTCRGFHGHFYALTPCRASWADWVFAICACVSLIALGVWEWL